MTDLELSIDGICRELDRSEAQRQTDEPDGYLTDEVLLNLLADALDDADDRRASALRNLHRKYEPAPSHGSGCDGQWFWASFAERRGDWQSFLVEERYTRQMSCDSRQDRRMYYKRRSAAFLALAEAMTQ